MQRVETALPGVCELRPIIHRDSRGFFLETYHRLRLSELGITDNFVQDNHSSSAQSTLRGLHYQLRHPQAKLCRVIEGEVLDIAVDIRLGSPHFGKWAAVRLSASEQNQLYIPCGFAHGFLALTRTVQFLYKCSDYYVREDEHGILWNDPALSIAWETRNPSLSEKDAKNRCLGAIPKELLPLYDAR